jgi:16S rRNA (guanine1207-N2)-methyltransferase
VEAEDRLAAQVAGSGRVLFIDFGPTAGDLAFHQDIRRHTEAEQADVESTFGPWLDPPTDPYDEVVLRMPRAKERLRMSLEMARAAVRPGGALTVVGHNDSGIRAAPRDVAALVGPTEVVGTRWHCRAVRATVDQGYPPTALDAFDAPWMLEDLEVHSFPGVFAHGRLDPGTALLLTALADENLSGQRVLDLGCGSGVIAAVAASRGAQADAVDADAVAVEAAARTGAPHGVRAYPSDLFSTVSGPYDRILTNPPFHRDGRVSLTTARELIATAGAHLPRSGELWMVVNRFLDHTEALRTGFLSFDLAAEDGHYRVWRARRG